VFFQNKTLRPLFHPVRLPPLSSSVAGHPRDPDALEPLGLPHACGERRGAHAKEKKSVRPHAAHHPREKQCQLRLAIDCWDNDEVGRHFTSIRADQPGAAGNITKVVMCELNQKFDLLASDNDNSVNSPFVDEAHNLVSEVRRRLLTEGPLRTQIPVPVSATCIVNDTVEMLAIG
jgi:hypothetical protein